ncbi:FxsA family protein, partial [Chitinimonas sp.]|uniref:FxsA family protein n=1 Tax=Chitinimonas sp. TaxID=1934313 RepID=UPI0035B4E9CA
VLAWYGSSAAVGLLILKSWRLTAAWALLDSVRSGELPLGRLFWVIRSLIAALLFVFPGPVSDVLGLLLILPWPGHGKTFGVADGVAAAMRATRARPGKADDGVIEGEFQEVDESRPSLPKDVH